MEATQSIGGKWRKNEGKREGPPAEIQQLHTPAKISRYSMFCDNLAYCMIWGLSSLIHVPNIHRILNDVGSFSEVYCKGSNYLSQRWATLTHATSECVIVFHSFLCDVIAFPCSRFPRHKTHIYSIHVPGWLLKWLNLITTHGTVSNEHGSVTWLATKYLKTVSWRNHTEELTTQNITFWPKINIPYSYLTILMLNCLESTLKLQFDSYVTAVKFFT